MKRLIHRLAHFFRLNALELIVVHDDGEFRTFYKCLDCGEVDE